jgi:hypothetical protein|tara:strand:- start:10 stop:171 length:162 start_codon:yes stop_codon:yes gene_type:complete
MENTIQKRIDRLQDLVKLEIDRGRKNERAISMFRGEIIHLYKLLLEKTPSVES